MKLYLYKKRKKKCIRRKFSILGIFLRNQTKGNQPIYNMKQSRFCVLCTHSCNGRFSIATTFDVKILSLRGGNAENISKRLIKIDLEFFKYIFRSFYNLTFLQAILFIAWIFASVSYAALNFTQSNSEKKNKFLNKFYFKTVAFFVFRVFFQ